MTLLLLILALLYFILFIRAFQKTRNSKESFGFIYESTTIIGAFVWEDLLVISFAAFVGTLAVLIARDIRVGLLFLALYWVVRSAGETLYFFLQQFHVPGHAPHNIDKHFRYLRWLLGDICTQKCYIIMQLIWQMTLVAASSLLVLLLLNWRTVPLWF